jgi:hypothetical protein
MVPTQGLGPAMHDSPLLPFRFGQVQNNKTTETRSRTVNGPIIIRLRCTAYVLVSGRCSRPTWNRPGGDRRKRTLRNWSFCLAIHLIQTSSFPIFIPMAKRRKPWKSAMTVSDTADVNKLRRSMPDCGRFPKERMPTVSLRGALPAKELAQSLGRCTLSCHPRTSELPSGRLIVAVRRVGLYLLSEVGPPSYRFSSFPILR